MSAATFDYQRAFSRNFGWVTAAEQETLRSKRIAIAGMGGVGGAHLRTLARLGVGNFNIADFDRFEIHNMNRQAGAFMSTMGQPKVDVMAGIGRDINPQADIRMFGEGVTPSNIDEFLRDVDVYVDSIDFFAMDARRLLFRTCYERGIPALTAAPLGMGVAMLGFAPPGMSFEQYFKVEGHDHQEQFARFIAGLSPAMLQRNYLVAPEAVNFVEQRGPSTGMACDLCAGVMGTAVLKVLLGRGRFRFAPWAMQFDAYRDRLSFTWRPGGNANPLQQLLLMLIRPRLRG
ncbi:ThiF family adenylyltransferase [Scleromatobacter humisilvae]|uniref:ThiF family adenylyltransferase n=1 Tax=Scleromatobacter humisilvae TaxID=2897159 RepID=A0A9X1YQR4_9BURK|nr:ThiF family adenylyltransferase [Scleromatobacter humisilvae]MCK9686376.1 ThiF family adenylyltransferase [Scleromatobacter humisilvae]